MYIWTNYNVGLALFKNWMLILVLLCENEHQRWDASRYIKARLGVKKNKRLSVTYRDLSFFAHSSQLYFWNGL